MRISFQSDVIATTDLIAELEQTDDPRRLEIVADLLGAARDARAIGPLLSRLGDPAVQENAYTEDSVCAALVGLGVMRPSGPREHTLLPFHHLDPRAAALVTQFAASLPPRYLQRRA